jgi:hypothetical protein
VAFPAVETTAETAVSTAGTNHAITLPASIAAGDLLLIFLDKGNTAATINSHADWTELLDENFGNGLYIAYRWATGSDSNPTLVSSASTRSATIAYRISGAENPATSPPQVGTTATGSGTAPDPPSLTAGGGTVKDYLWIACFGRDGEEADDDTWATGPPSGYTGLLQKACGVAGTNLGGMIATAHRQLNAAVENPTAFAVATGGWRANTVAVHPAAAPTSAPHRPKTFNYSDDPAVVRANRW